MAKITPQWILTCGLDSTWLGQRPKVASFEYGHNTLVSSLSSPMDITFSKRTVFHGVSQLL